MEASQKKKREQNNLSQVSPILKRWKFSGENLGWLEWEANNLHVSMLSSTSMRAYFRICSITSQLTFAAPLWNLKLEVHAFLIHAAFAFTSYLSAYHVQNAHFNQIVRVYLWPSCFSKTMVEIPILHLHYESWLENLRIKLKKKGGFLIFMRIILRSQHSK
jgi:hypothetical protein